MTGNDSNINLMAKDIRTEKPFWLMKNGFLTPFSALTADAKADVVIIGGGISGSLLADALADEGVSVILLERDHMAMGSTAASTALLQYDIDRTLTELIDLIGEKRAVRAYELSLNALTDLIERSKKLKFDVELSERVSLRFASSVKDARLLEKEFKARSAHGFEVEMWNADQVAAHFPFKASAALQTSPSATADPYRMTHSLLVSAADKGARLYDKTRVKKIERRSRSVVIHTERGPKITAGKIVIACGYESVDHIPKKLASLSSTYAIATEPIAGGQVWYKDCTFWNTGDPYLYGRTTSDNRIIFGGEDEEFFDPRKRDQLLPAKTKKLEKKLREMFPHIDLRVDYSWAGTFIETGDGLPYIGSIKQLPHTYFALGYGGNGITFSKLAADILSDLILGKSNKDAAIFSFDRTTD